MLDATVYKSPALQDLHALEQKLEVGHIDSPAGAGVAEQLLCQRVLHLDGVAGLTDDLLAILDLRGVISDVQLLHDHYSPFAAALRIARSSFS